MMHNKITNLSFRDTSLFLQTLTVQSRKDNITWFRYRDKEELTLTAKLPSLGSIRIIAMSDTIWVSHGRTVIASVDTHNKNYEYNLRNLIREANKKASADTHWIHKTPAIPNINQAKVDTAYSEKIREWLHSNKTW